MFDLIHLLRSRISWRDVLVLMISLEVWKIVVMVLESALVTKLKLKNIT